MIFRTNVALSFTSPPVAAGTRLSRNHICPRFIPVQPKCFSSVPKNGQPTGPLLPWVSRSTLETSRPILRSSTALARSHSSKGYLESLKGIVVLDFDGTLTKQDTIQEITTLRASKFASENEKEAYTQNVTAVVTAYLEDRKRTTSFQSSANLSLGEVLDAADRDEYRSLDRVEERRLLSGLTRSELYARGKEIAKKGLQDGVREFFAAAKSNDIQVYICSANWSNDLIRGALAEFEGTILGIVSSDLEYDSHGISTGIIRKQIVTGKHKHEFVSEIKQNEIAALVYIGDGQPDCLALMEADLGILVGTGSSLRNALLLGGMQLVNDYSRVQIRGDGFEHFPPILDLGLDDETSHKSEDGSASDLLEDDSQASNEYAKNVGHWSVITRVLFGK